MYTAFDIVLESYAGAYRYRIQHQNFSACQCPPYAMNAQSYHIHNLPSLLISLPSSHHTGNALHAQRHNGVDYIIVVLLQRLDSLLPRHGRLLHDELDVLALKSLFVNLLSIIIVILVLLGVAAINGLTLAVVVAGVGVCLGLDNLLGGGGLSLGVEVLDLGLAEDAVVLY